MADGEEGGNDKGGIPFTNSVSMILRAQPFRELTNNNNNNTYSAQTNHSRLQVTAGTNRMIIISLLKYLKAVF